MDWILPIDNNTIPATMTMEELHNKISSFKKATYITVYALSACIPGISPVVIAVIPSDQNEKAELNNYNNNLIIRELYFAGAMTIGLYFDRAALDQNWLDESTLILNAFENFPINLHFMDNSLPFICGTDIYHCIKKGRNMHISGTRVCSIGHYIMIDFNFVNSKLAKFLPNYPLCPWIISTAFLEHIFGYARRIIEDFTVLDFLLISEKILQTIKIEMKGNLIRPDNNNGYNIKLSTSKENLPKELSNFPSVFEINNVVKEFSSAMKHILCSLGIKINQEDFSSLIQQSICSLKKNNNDEILLEGINNNINISTEEEIEEQRLLGRSNLSNLNFTNLNQIYDEEIHLDLESEKKYDYYTQQEKRKIGNKAMLNKKNLTVVTELGTMDITTAIRYDRLNSNEQQIRTKGRIARWKTACKKIFDSIKLNPQALKFKKSDYYYYCESRNSIVIAEIIAKYGSSYVRVDLLDGSNEGRIHARLYDLKLDSDQEFVPIISSNRAQFVCESNIFRFIACLGSVLEEYHSNSYWLEKILKLRDLQYTTYFHFVEKSCELEQSIKEAERIMKSKKTSNLDDNL
ncbi:hypothetical protein C2G38_2204104 [Gigaspora rosea]|uniref:Uncharacterized protein n=1 Tax=Gigaspora rosea TaxID=44941 RepID=A0A397UPS4_9GLOM|nr:hypothetical protein C2G38_2204104 [Gigaspora rosea]